MKFHSLLVAVGLTIGVGDGGGEQQLGPDLQPELHRGEAGPTWALTDLGFPGGGSVYGYAINDAGTIGGATVAAGQPFLLDASGGLTVLPPARDPRRRQPSRAGGRIHHRWARRYQFTGAVKSVLRPLADRADRDQVCIH